MLALFSSYPSSSVIVILMEAEGQSYGVEFDGVEGDQES